MKAQLRPSSPTKLHMTLRPPGVVTQSIQNCTNCGRCVEAYPRGVLALTEEGVIIIPERGECSFCGVSANICPEPVFDVAQPIQHHFEISDVCLARSGITCMICRDSCPEMAITMPLRAGAPFLPQLNTEICTGCGACVGPCPANAMIAVRKGAEVV